jgi:hypothetical protein
LPEFLTAIFHHDTRTATCGCFVFPGKKIRTGQLMLERFRYQSLRDLVSSIGVLTTWHRYLSEPEVLPMVSGLHGQDARATFLQNCSSACKELCRKRLSAAI